MNGRKMSGVGNEEADFCVSSLSGVRFGSGSPEYSEDSRERFRRRSISMMSSEHPSENGRPKGALEGGDPHVQEVVRAAHEELRQLMRQRADVMKRIGTVKQTIVGLAHLFGDDVLSEGV